MSTLKGGKCIVTPNLLHTTNCDWQVVYEPAEDTFLLLDALEQDLDFIISRKPKLCLEVGSGSGVVITALSKVLNCTAHCMAVDVNVHACQLTKKTSHNNNAFVDVMQGDLTSSLRNCVVDMVMFNPPYVVTPSDEVRSKDGLTRSWAGGEKGREVIDRFLMTMPEFLDKNGFGYILLLKENDPQDVMKILSKENFEAEVIARRKLRGEELYIIKFVKTKPGCVN